MAVAPPDLHRGLAPHACLPVHHHNHLLHHHQLCLQPLDNILCSPARLSFTWIELVPLPVIYFFFSCAISSDCDTLPSRPALLSIVTRPRVDNKQDPPVAKASGPSLSHSSSSFRRL